MSAPSLRRILIRPLDDLPSDYLWEEAVYKLVLKLASQIKIGIIGHLKDSSTYYLKNFAKWPLVEVENYHNINGTEIRKILATSTKEKAMNKLEHMLAKEVVEMLM